MEIGTQINPEKAMRRFETVLGGVLRISKVDIQREEAKEKAGCAGKPKRGRPPKVRANTVGGVDTAKSS